MKYEICNHWEFCMAVGCIEAIREVDKVGKLPLLLLSPTIFIPRPLISYLLLGENGYRKDEIPTG